LLIGAEVLRIYKNPVSVPNNGAVTGSSRGRRQMGDGTTAVGFGLAEG